MKHDTIFDKLMTRAIAAGLLSNTGKVYGLPFHIGWKRVSYHSQHRRGFVELAFENDGTRWYWSWENAHGLWSLSVHMPVARFYMIGPFTGHRHQSV